MEVRSIENIRVSEFILKSRILNKGSRNKYRTETMKNKKREQDELVHKSWKTEDEDLFHGFLKIKMEVNPMDSIV